MTRHQRRIAQLLEGQPDAKTTGFSAACNRIVALTTEAKFRLAMIPDAFHVDHEARRITAYEIEETCPVSADKMALYADLWWSLDGAEWSLFLIRLTRDGDEKVTDIGDYALEKLVADVSATGNDGSSADIQRI